MLLRRRRNTIWYLVAFFLVLVTLDILVTFSVLDLPKYTPYATAVFDSVTQRSTGIAAASRSHVEVALPDEPMLDKNGLHLEAKQPFELIGDRGSQQGKIAMKATNVKNASPFCDEQGVSARQDHDKVSSIEAASHQNDSPLSTLLCNDVPGCTCFPFHDTAVAQLPLCVARLTRRSAVYTEQDFCNSDVKSKCEDATHPVQIIKSRGGYVTLAEAKCLLAQRRILLIGDSTIRRLMFGLCSFLEGQPYPDRYGSPVYHDTLRCPDGMAINSDPRATESSSLKERQNYVRDWKKCGPLFNDKTARGLNLSLEFRWAPISSKVSEVLAELAKGSSRNWDFLVLGFFVHGLAEDRYQVSGDLRENAQAVLEGYRTIFSNPVMAELPPMLVFTPNLVDGQLKETIDFNEVLVQSMQSMINMSTPSTVSVVDSTSWMGTETITQRHACLSRTYIADRPHPLYNSHLDSTYGSLLQVQFILQELRLKLGGTKKT
eukprot:gnl/MRDRNA2_/MRDRNA2_139835_c0_seq1.p1 gnl/MRDRNA2_/MRDRNA2_139835_c0~~gnl/MRDRNA2_/MRDRNA2_139835_c0_seq1.p1  ORF type:complete len:489 (-),score=72.06 gnl/MRDRNA2_/MRDRNA2_139835_c0_seq1:39-1505(-)